MKRFVFGLFALGCFALLTVGAVAEDATAVIDKAIKAHGGEEALSKVKSYSITTKGAVFFMGSESQINTKATVKGFDHARREFEGDFGGTKFTVLTVIAGDKAWTAIGDMGVRPMEAAQLANAKRTGYIDTVAITILPLKSKEYKTTLVADDKIGDKAVATVKATGPDGKDFTLCFDKESGLLLKITAEGVLDFTGQEFKQEMLFTDYKDMGGIKKAAKSEGLRDGEKFVNLEYTEFKLLDKVDDSTFAEPK